MQLQELQRHSRERAFYTLGTAKLFERRALSLEKWRSFITYLGILVPLLVGGAVLSFGTAFLPYVAVTAGLLGLAQLSLSVWSLVKRWDEKHIYAVSSLRSNTALFNAWDAIAKRPPDDIESRVRELDAEDQRQEQADLTQNITDQEKRFAMRAALYHFGLPCERCKRKPESMKPLECDTCGNF
jgi:mobilome CxxCx(11)CxxC protein